MTNTSANEFEIMARTFDHTVVEERLANESRINTFRNVLSDVRDLPQEFHSDTISVPKNLLARLALCMSDLEKDTERFYQAVEVLGEDVDDLMQTYDEANEIVSGKYENDRDQRIILAAVVIHLATQSPTAKARALSENFARSVLNSFADTPVIGEPVDEDYILELLKTAPAASHD